MALINIKIEGVPYQVEEGLTILEAAKKCGYEIPSLCAFNPLLDLIAEMVYLTLFSSLNMIICTFYAQIASGFSRYLLYQIQP